MSKGKALELLGRVKATITKRKWVAADLSVLIESLEAELETIHVVECNLCSGTGECAECNGSGECSCCNGTGEET